MQIFSGITNFFDELLWLFEKENFLTQERWEERQEKLRI